MSGGSASAINNRIIHTLIFGVLFVMSTVRFETTGTTSPTEIANVLAIFGGAGLVLSLVRVAFGVVDALHEIVAEIATAEAAGWTESGVRIALAGMFVRDYLSPPSVSHYWPETVALLQAVTAAAVAILLISAIMTMPPVRDRLNNIPAPGVPS